MDNPEKLATLSTPNDEKDKKKTTTQYVLDTIVRKQTEIT